MRKSPLLSKKLEERINIVAERNSKGLLPQNRNPDYLDYRYNLEKNRLITATRAHKSENNVIISLKNENNLLRKQ